MSTEPRIPRPPPRSKWSYSCPQHRVRGILAANYLAIDYAARGWIMKARMMRQACSDLLNDLTDQDLPHGPP